MRTTILVLLLNSFTVCGLNALAEEVEERETWLSPVEVFGAQSEVIEYPNEPQRVSSKKLEILQTTDVARALKQVSGTYVREEDGFGLRPNIGMRGTSPDRSKKIVLLEDGVLIGPAPYSAPAAYYSPSMMMVDSLEVYKGFGSLPFGPNSIGGTINFLTTPIPQNREARFKLTGGSFNTGLMKGSFGGPLGNSSFLVEAARIQTDGFKKLPTGANTGFEQNQFLLKWMLKLPNADGLDHHVRVHLGYGDERSNETYLGLSPTDFYRDPYNRLIGSEKDLMSWMHGKVQMHHQIQVSQDLMVQTALYQHSFKRAWYRLDGMRDTSVNLREVLRDTETYKNYYDVLSGRLDSSAIGTNAQLVVVNNDRNYLSRGVQNQWAGSLTSGEVANDFEFGWRYHEDYINRDHTSDRYDVTSGRMVQTADLRQRDTLNSEGAKAWTVALSNHVKWNGWTVTPAFRFESVQFTFKDFLTGSDRPRSDQVFLPGFSLMKKVGDASAIKASVNRAATLSGLSATGTERREESLLYELEWNHSNAATETDVQAALFLNDYQNITGTCTVSTGCSGLLLDTQFNGGAARIWGAELKLGKKLSSRAMDFPVSLSMTYLKAQFANDFISTSPEWGVGQIRSGDPLPYVPELQGTLSLGMSWGRFFNELAIVYQSSVFDQSLQLNRETIDPYGILDWAASWSLSKTTKIVGKIDNLLAKQYVVSARPFGLRPGKPQAIQVGFQITF